MTVLATPAVLSPPAVRIVVLGRVLFSPATFASRGRCPGRPTSSADVDLGTLPRVDPGQFGAVGGRDRRADRTVALSYTDAVTQMACWEERSQVCDEIRLTLAEVRRRTTSAVPAWGPRGTTPRLSSSSSSSSTALHCIALHCTALHCTALHCIEMH